MPERKLMGDFEKICDFANLMEAAHACGNGVRWKASVQAFDITRLRQCARLKKQLENGTYKSKGFHEFTINERGKTRRIQSVHISERCVQKSLCNNVMKPAIVPKLVYDNAASLKGKGTEFALGRLKCHLERHYRKHGLKGGILTMDFKNYFGNISHEILLLKLRSTFTDEKVYDFLKQFVTAFDEGLGLGSEISQISAIYFPNELDHLIKEKLHIKGYGRYMDDSYLLHESIDHLRYCLTEIEKTCDKYGIVINRKRTVITPVSKCFVYLKKRVRLQPNGRVSMRIVRKNITARRRKLKAQHRAYLEGKLTMATIAQSYQSWRGYAKQYDSYNALKDMDKLYHELFGVWPERKKKNGRRSIKGSKGNERANQRAR